jgi:pimeloyl-ACP methyl ester carboxylesterase
MKKLIAAAIVSGAFLFSGCTGGNGTVTGQANLTGFNGNPGGSTPPTQKAASTALFQPAAGLLPYPTDLYFFGSTDGTLNIQPPNPLMPNQAAVNALDGFSTNAVIRENFAGALDPKSFTKASIIVVPVTTDNQTKATTGVLGAPLILGTDPTKADYMAALATDAGVGPTILEITPLHPLMPSTCISGGMFLGPNCKTGTGYLVILTNGITDVSGHPAVPDTDYASIKAALASGGKTCPSITDKTLNGICQLTGAHLLIAQALGLNPANIVLTFSFTTQSTTDTLELLSATAQPQPLKLNATGLPTSAANPLLPGHANIFVGVLTIPYYLSKSAPLTGYWNAPPFPLDPTSTFVTRFNPVPAATQNLLIPVLATVPNAKSAAVMAGATGPWPVLIFQHGITRNREDMLGVADSFADAGFAVVAIDLPLHGVTSTKDPLYASAANLLYAGLGLPASQMSIERTFDLDVENNTTGAAGPDGVTDPSGSHFINLTSLLTSRDNLREGAADLITFERSVAGATVANGGNATIFASGKTHYLGHSLGAIVGGVFLGVIPPTDVSTGTLAMPGGNVSQLLQSSPSFAPQINAGLQAQGLMPGSTLYAQFFRDAQTVVDAGDPVNYIALATVQHPIHILQVVGSTPPPANCNPNAPQTGCPDQVVPNSATQALITASAYAPAGLTAAPLTRITAGQAPVVVNPGGIRGYVNFIEGDHGSIIDDVVPPVTVEMQTEAISFTGSAIPPAGIAANTPGTTLLLANPSVIQP